MARISTWLWVAMLAASLLVIGFIVVEHGREDEPQGRRTAEGHGEYQPTALLPVSQGGLSALEIIASGGRYRFEKNAGGAWFFHGHSHHHDHAGDGSTPGHQHEVDPERSQRLAKSIAMFGRIKSDRTVRQGGEIDRESFGLRDPEMVVTAFVETTVQPALSIQVGDKAPDGFGRYVFVVEKKSIEIVPDYHIENLKELIGFVRQETD